MEAKIEIYLTANEMPVELQLHINWLFIYLDYRSANGMLIDTVHRCFL